MKSFSKSSIFFLLLFAALVWGGGETLAQQNECYNTQWIVQPPNDIGIHTDEPDKPLHIYAWPNNCNDPAIKLSAGQPEYAGYLSLLTPGNLSFYTKIQNRSAGDLVLSTDADASDLILSTSSNTGCIRFATTPEEGDDLERMTITSEGRVGISNTNPMNLFSTKITTGLDF